MQTVNPFGQRLAFDTDWIGELDGSVLIGAGPPHFAIGLEATKNLASFDQRTVIADGDVGDPNLLHDLCALAVARQIKDCRLGVSRENTSKQCCKNECCQQGVSTHRAPQKVMECVCDKGLITDANLDETRQQREAQPGSHRVFLQISFSSIYLMCRKAVGQLLC